MKRNRNMLSGGYVRYRRKLPPIGNMPRPIHQYGRYSWSVNLGHGRAWAPWFKDERNAHD